MLIDVMRLDLLIGTAREVAHIVLSGRADREALADLLREQAGTRFTDPDAMRVVQVLAGGMIAFGRDLRNRDDRARHAQADRAVGHGVAA